MGILICDDMLAPDPVFCFIPLPVPQNKSLCPPCGRGRPEYRSVSCNVKLLSSTHTIKFVSLDGYLEGCPADQLVLTKFSLHLSDPVSKSVWSKDYSISLGRMSLPERLFTSSDPSHVKPPYKAKCPLISVVHDDLIYLNITDMPGDYYVALCQGMVVEFSLCPRSRLGPKFVSSFSMFLNKKVLSDFLQRRSKDLVLDEFSFCLLSS
ncbi:hypothetical protein C2845_PM15G16880 [Panicum miliaceum]|uniref:DUF1618 domain-containing protein n=1 Tax=Panicum miliaceum TaxID=4540 RepID=A0A3L6QBX8_PANMI|nr:hypothetical protein C2845_PM15G16880 [Panicum miliaceum]